MEGQMSYHVVSLTRGAQTPDMEVRYDTTMLAAGR